MIFMWKHLYSSYMHTKWNPPHVDLKASIKSLLVMAAVILYFSFSVLHVHCFLYYTDAQPMLILPASAKKSVLQSGNLRKTHSILFWCRWHSPKPFLTEAVNLSVVMHKKKNRFSIKLSRSSQSWIEKPKYTQRLKPYACQLILYIWMCLCVQMVFFPL